MKEKEAAQREADALLLTIQESTCRLYELMRGHDVLVGPVVAFKLGELLGLLRNRDATLHG